VIDGTRYSHVVDPRTGIGLTNRTAATVIAKKGILADALSTALTVMGMDEGLAFIEREYPEVRAYVRELP
jgi:FAD:protein FMN transferase